MSHVWSLGCFLSSLLTIRRSGLLVHFLFVIMVGEILSFTVQPKAGRWMKLGYFCIEVYIL